MNNLVLNEIQEKISGKNCRLIAVTKTQPVSVLLEAYQLGLKIFGENKVQEMTEKYDALPKDIQWHMIGHLQSNKVKYIAQYVSLIQSVDSLSLLKEINKQAAKYNRIIPCLLQIHIAREETKFGLSSIEAEEILNMAIQNFFPNVSIKGLMGMASNTDSIEQITSEFKGLKQLKDSLSLKYFNMEELSMGMSGDYKIAVEEGSTMIRIGSAIFGKRDYINP